MTRNLTVACVQVNAGPEIKANLVEAERLIRAAAAKGATLITLPENVSLMVHEREKLFAIAKNEKEHPAIPLFSRLARETNAWIVAGSLAVAIGGDRLANRCYVFGPTGKIVAKYDKIHMFDADVAANESYRESSRYRPGLHAVTAPTPWGMIGLTICYDVRFPQLFRALAKAGANVITVPAAFVASTGEAHWHVLLRARAIETGSFIIAPAQCGEHDGGRRTFGHSLIISPWGDIIAEADDQPGLITATLNLADVESVRQKLQCLQHDRDFVGPLACLFS